MLVGVVSRIQGFTSGAARGYNSVMTETMKPSVPFYGMQRGEHGLMCDRALLPGEKAQRRFACTCGKTFGTSYDNAAKANFRAHLAAVKSPCSGRPQCECADHRSSRGGLGYETYMSM